jgi:hypothetical protein
MWMWAVAMVGTVAGLALAGRAVLRAEAAVAVVRREVRDVGDLGPARDELEAGLRATAASRVRLHTEVHSDI